MSLRPFYTKHKVKIIMLTPIFIGLAFFFYSAISALITVNTTDIPDNFDNVNVEISDYQIQQIDEATNQVKWILNAEEAETSTDDTEAKIHHPSLIYYEAGKPKFTITAANAKLDQKNQQVVLNDNVILKTSDGKYTIRAGEMFFKESNPFIEFSKNWKIENNEGYKIDGVVGMVSKDFSTIISKNNAKLNKDAIDILGDEIRLDLNSSEPVKAYRNAVLKISEEQKLYANEIKISKNGNVKATGAVNVKTPEIDCFSNNLDITAKANKSPKLAIFTGNPHIVQSGNSIYSDKIIYDFDTKQASMEGGIHSGS